MKGRLWRPNDIRGTCGPKASRHLSYRWGKPRKKLTQETCPDRGSNPGPLPPDPQQWTFKIIIHVLIWELFWGIGMLSSCICSTLVCMCNERYSHRVTGSVRKGLHILPHSFLLSSKLRWCTALVVHVEGRTCLRAEYFTYIPTCPETATDKFSKFFFKT